MSVSNPFQSYGLNVPSKYLFSLSSPAAGSAEKRFIVAAHLTWIRCMVILLLKIVVVY